MIRAKLPPQTLRTAILTGKEWESHEALAGAMIDKELVCVLKKNEKEGLKKQRKIFLEGCIHFARKLAPYSRLRSNYTRLKEDLYSEVLTLDILVVDPPRTKSRFFRNTHLPYKRNLRCANVRTRRPIHQKRQPHQLRWHLWFFL